MGCECIPTGESHGSVKVPAVCKRQDVLHVILLHLASGKKKQKESEGGKKQSIQIFTACYQACEIVARE